MKCAKCGHEMLPQKSGLTPKQINVLLLIEDYKKEHGENASPTLSDLAQSLGIARSNVHRYLDELQKRGFIHRRYGQQRTIQLIH